MPDMARSRDEELLGDGNGSLPALLTCSLRSPLCARCSKTDA